MIDPIDSLSFSIHANPGIYAVLVGSGVSRTAQILTGWEITLDLVRRLAVLVKEDCGDEPAEWYRNKFGKDPDYAELLDGVAKTPAARQQLLKSYWEPTAEEREDGAKQPTKAHRAIADLAAKGFVKVIVTTNFDKLFETALADVGIVPTVLSTTDSIEGALPLIHTKCTVIKVHGDYLDTRIKNTPDELKVYDPQFDAVLDRVFDEFGLIVCGWSADWDVALRAAITRAPTRRYAMYWASRGTPGEAAQQLINHRQAIQLPIDGADIFFSAVADKVQSLVEFSRPHPLSTAVAVTSLKRFMTEPKFRIQHEDLVVAEVERVAAQLNFEKYPPLFNQELNTDFLTSRVRSYELLMQSVLAMAVQGGYWAEPAQYKAWTRALARLGSAQPPQSGVVTVSEFQKYPASLTFYCLGLAAVEAGKWDFITELCETAISRETREDELAIDILPSGSLIQQYGHGKLLEGMDGRFAPLSDWMRNLFLPIFRQLIPSETKYTYVFDKLEILFALAQSVRRKESWYRVPLGAFGYRAQNRERILDEIETSIDSKGTESPYLSSALLGNHPDAALDQIKKLKQHVSKLNWD